MPQREEPQQQAPSQEILDLRQELQRSQAALSGLILDQRVYVGAAQALDSRRQVVPIP